jgi:long-subunit acyl-CoA synthetase (AMP-forming)
LIDPDGADVRTTAWIHAGACLESGDAARSLREAVAAVRGFATTLASRLAPARVVGLLADNSPRWLTLDIALQAAGLVVVPLPAFFTREQMLHAVHASGMRALISADTTAAAQLGFNDAIGELGELRCLGRADRPTRGELAAEGSISKITFTSGTTGTPKGVLLTFDQQLATARALARLLAPLGIRRHLCTLPLPVLLENVAGAYTAAILGAACICPPLAELGVAGSSGFDAEGCLDAIARYRPDSMIVLPQMLQALVTRLARRDRASAARSTRSLKLVAVGGAKTPAPLVAAARSLGLPAYEGYGLSECASVVCLNVPGADRVGSVGRPLPGLDVRLAADGEIEIAGRAFAGYLGAAAPSARHRIASGDLGAIDADGYMTIIGRKKNVLVTSFGRNVSPEWPEGLLAESPLIAQAAVFGDACPFLAAVVVPASPAVDNLAIAAHIAHVNARLPDYARLGGWVRATEPFGVRNGLGTANGRLRRDRVALCYAARLAALYPDPGRALVRSAAPAIEKGL